MRRTKRAEPSFLWRVADTLLAVLISLAAVAFVLCAFVGAYTLLGWNGVAGLGVICIAIYLVVPE